jgi:hypothetical protein
LGYLYILKGGCMLRFVASQSFVHRCVCGLSCSKSDLGASPARPEVREFLEVVRERLGIVRQVKRLTNLRNEEEYYARDP